jgi:hypothetical protein
LAPCLVFKAFSGDFLVANNIIKTIINNGSKSIVFFVYMESDGNEGELVNYPIIDPAKDYVDENGNQLAGSKDIRPVVTQVWHSFSWFDALLSFDALTPAPSWFLARDASNYVDLRYFGGLKERFTIPQDKFSSDRTGKLLITTSGFAPLGSMGTMVIELRKG